MPAGLAFSLRLPLRFGEPAHGLLLRLAERYRVQPARLGARWDLTLGGLARGVGLDAFASALDIDATTLAAWSPVVRTRARRVDLRGEELMLGDWSVTGRRWCPACFEEDALLGEHQAYHRAWWDVRSIGACPAHLVMLHSRCPACSTRTGWRRPSVARCRCGYAFAGARREPVLPYEVAMTLTVAGRLGATADAQPHAAEMPLSVLPAFALRLGAALNCPWSERRPVRLGLDAEKDMSTALACLHDPEPAFEEALARMSTGMAGRPAGLGGAYGWAYTRWLAFPDQDRTGGRLLATMRAHAVANGIIGEDEPVLGRDRADGLAVTDIAARLGIGFDTAKAAVQAAWPGYATVRRGVAAAVPVAAVRDLERRGRDGVDGAAAARLLGCSRRIVRELRDLGVLEAEEGRYDRAEVLGLPGRLASAKPVAQDLVPIVDMARGGGPPLARLCAAVLAGGIGSGLVDRDTFGLASVGVVAADVPNERRASDLSVRGIAARLGVHEEAVGHLVRLGLLSDGASIRPTAAGVALFERDFVTAAEVARGLGVDRRSVSSMLARLGIDRVLGPPECRQVFFRRRDVERLRLGPDRAVASLTCEPRLN